MSLNLMYITNSTKIATLAEKSGVDIIFIDLEINGKEERQGHLDTVISKHSMQDIPKVKSVLKKSKLLVRVNPIDTNSKEEIKEVIKLGADIVMLPFFKKVEEVKKFIEFVDGKAKTCLLCETPEAVDNIDQILEINGIDFIHIGLNDLHLGYGLKFMFELLSNGTVEKLCKKIRDKDIKYGFGGIAKLGEGELPAEIIVAEHYNLKSDMVILSRSFCNTKIKTIEEIENLFEKDILELRKYEKKISLEREEFFIDNKSKLKNIVEKICSRRS